MSERATRDPADRPAGDRLSCALLLMARQPIPGKVKSRLGQELGAEGACGIYQAMAADTWATMRSLGPPCYLSTDGDCPAWLPGAAKVVRQPESGFGARLQSAADDLLADGHRAVVALAADTPHIDVSVLREAVTVLTRDHANVVTCAAEDGGLVLLGLRLPSPIDLQRLPWESRQLNAGVAEAASHLRHARLAPDFYDIDTLRDMQRLLGEPPEVHRRCPLTIAACRRVLTTNGRL
jgi:glycosyltransferase A (GT-A) superfamily protein (DUF2064 family)